MVFLICGCFRIYGGWSIKVAPLANLSQDHVLVQDDTESLLDLQIYSRRKQNGTNACSVTNGGCEQLCLFNGTHPVCSCSYGMVASDGKSCQRK